MSQADFRNRRVPGQMGVYHSVIDRLMQHLQVTGVVDDCHRSSKPRRTTFREDRQIVRCARRNHFATSARIRDELNLEVVYM